MENKLNRTFKNHKTISNSLKYTQNFQNNWGKKNCIFKKFRELKDREIRRKTQQANHSKNTKNQR